MAKLDPLALVLQRFQSSEDFFTINHRKYSETYYRSYRGIPDKGKSPYRNVIFDKITYTLCEVITARMMATVFQSNPIITIVPQEGSDARLAMQLEKVLQNLLNDPEAEFFLELQDFFKQDVMAGTSYLKITPNFNVTGSGKNRDLKFNGFLFETIDYMNGYPDPSGRRISKSKFFIDRQLANYDDLLEAQELGMYKNVEDIKGNHDEYDVVKQRLADLGIGSSGSTYDPDTGQIELLNHYSDGHVITIAGRSTVIRDSMEDSDKPIPSDIPIIDVRYSVVPREFMGIGLPEQIEQDQDYINFVKSGSMDNLEILINKLFTMKIGSATDPRDIKALPGGIIPVGEKGDVDELAISDLSQSAFKILEGLERKIQDVSGEWGYGRGETPDRKETLGGIARLQDATLGRFDLTVKNFEFAGIRSIGQKCIEILRKFGNEDLFKRILGEAEYGEGTDFFNKSIESLLKEYDISPVGSTVTANKALKAEQAMQAHSVVSAIPPDVAVANGFNVNLEDSVRNVLDSINYPSIDKLITKAEQPPQQQAGLPGGIPNGPPQSQIVNQFGGNLER